MKRVNFLAASAALMLWSMAQAHAAPKLNAEPPATEAEATLEQIEDWSTAISDAAFHLSDNAIRQRDPQGHIEGLDVLRDDINKIGGGLEVSRRGARLSCRLGNQGLGSDPAVDEGCRRQCGEGDRDLQLRPVATLGYLVRRRYRQSLAGRR